MHWNISHEARNVISCTRELVQLQYFLVMLILLCLVVSQSILLLYSLAFALSVYTHHLKVLASVL